MNIPQPWVLDMPLSILVGVVGSLVVWNFETVVAGVGSLVSSTLA